MSDGNSLKGFLPSDSYLFYENFVSQDKDCFKEADLNKLSIRKTIKVFEKKASESSKGLSVNDVSTVSSFIDSAFQSKWTYKKQKSIRFKIRLFLNNLFGIKLGAVPTRIQKFNQFCNELQKKIYHSELIEYQKNPPEGLTLEIVKDVNGEKIQLSGTFRGLKLDLPEITITSRGGYVTNTSKGRANYKSMKELISAHTLALKNYQDMEPFFVDESDLKECGMGSFTLIPTGTPTTYNLTYYTKIYAHETVRGRYKAHVEYTKHEEPIHLTNEGYCFSDGVYSSIEDLFEAVKQEVIKNNPELESKFTPASKHPLNRKDISGLALQLFDKTPAAQMVKVSRQLLKDSGFISSHSFYISRENITGPLQIFKKVHGEQGVLGTGGFKTAKTVKEIGDTSQEVIADQALAKGKLIFEGEAYSKKNLNFTDSEKDFYENVNREGDIAANWLVPNVVKYKDSTGSISEGVWFIGDVADCDLSQIDFKTLNLEDIKSIFYQMCNSVHQLHLQDRVHRDIKPANFLYMGNQVLLTDFDMLKDTNSEAFVNNRYSRSGTNYYIPKPVRTSQRYKLSKEQYKKIDSYALVCSYKVLIGKLEEAKNPNASKLKNLKDELSLILDNADQLDFEKYQSDIRSYLPKNSENYTGDLDAARNELKNLGQLCLDKAMECNKGPIQELLDRVDKITDLDQVESYISQLQDLHIMTNLSALPTVDSLVNIINRKIKG